MENNVRTFNSVKNIGRSDYIMMGNLRLRQPLPTNEIETIDPFILLHHFGPFVVNEVLNPLDLGPHPHRGFEPVTFVLQGEQLHRDSLGNESIVKAGDVQWTTAGRGIIHAEGPSKEFVKRGGTIEGIQLWINLPAAKKMMPANYQHIKKEDFSFLKSDDNKVSIQIIAGNLLNQKGKITTQTALNAYIIDAKESGEIKVPMSKNHQSLLYLIDGDVSINDSIQLKKNENQLIEFNQDGDGFNFKSNSESRLLFLSGEPIKEKVTSYGPYVMNTQTEILEAMRDYQMGKMGFLPRN
ncbi:MAG: pirin family protein [Flavobacteriaceae bacterium]